jgi:hypothetical protein
MRPGSGGRCYTFLSDTAGKPVEALVEVQEWLAVVGRFVAIRDGLCQSFALDFDRENGDPDRPQTEIGALRARAKPYGAPATEDTLEAANELAHRMVAFLSEMTSYRCVNAVVAMPPSSPDKPFDLPGYLAGEIARRRSLPNLSAAIRTVAARPQMKNVPKEAKVAALLGTLEVEPTDVAKKSILLVDDLYQSGASANVAAFELLEKGAKRVLGLFCEKTCRNDDNVR